MKIAPSIFISCLLLYSGICSATVRIAVVPVQFDDVRFTGKEQAVESRCAAAQKYFNESFHSELTFEFIPMTCCTTPEKYTYYGKNSGDAKDALFHEAAVEACIKADKTEDFSKIDHICFVTAGKSEACDGGEDWFWSQQTEFPAGVTLILDGKRFTKYAICTEYGANDTIDGYGTMCHETGHLLGLPDFYDTDEEKSGGKGAALRGDLSIMDRGDKLDVPPLLGAVELDCLGKGKPSTPEKGTIRLEPVEIAGKFLKISTGTPNEHFLAENRRGKGLVIYHIDRSDNEAGWSDYRLRILTAAQRWKYNEINCNPSHQCAEAIGDGFFPYMDNCFDFKGRTAATDITICSDGTISMTFLQALSVTEITPLQESATIVWTSDFPGDRIHSCSLTVDGRSFNDTKGSFNITGLTPGKEYPYEMTLVTTDRHSFSTGGKFTTLAKHDGSIPFIYFKDSKRNGDGTFIKGQKLTPVVFNNPGTDVIWYFNGEKINAESGVTINGSGTITAVMTLPDGSRTLLRKKINVR